ncbi:hypothetical protein FQN60_006402 [Etheostoma spectabile]|uniref:Crossover junction endonuclease MUS81 n=1 Tax=Etheostoma spectabile TaxID=54343 RepID=A0A5J5CTF8_9PERO|nr:hypothetical protein FQN60_006402 [Etheostoma spectabile]
MPASEPVRFGRKRALPSCPNPLFLKWLTELRDEAKEKGLKIQYTYQKRQRSSRTLGTASVKYWIKNCNDTLKRTAQTLLFTVSLKEHPKNAAGDQGKDKRGRGGGRKKREYVPQKRSGGYAVLLTLYRQSQIPGSKGYMFKMELQAEAQRLCDKSFTVPDLGSKYTAWSSVSTLIQKNFVMKTHNPARYSLTEEGLALAERLESIEQETKDGPGGDREEARSEGEGDAEEEDGGPGLVDLTASDDDKEEKEEDRIHPTETPTCVALPRSDVDGMGLSENPQKSHATSRKPNAACLLPGTYEIILCVDFIETTGGSSHRKQELVKELQRNGVTFDVRKLNVGDFLWVAREKMAPLPGQLRAPAGRELVLDYIIERKRMDDLCGSIIDGRFREQKFRLKRCGLRRPCYLVEECGSAASHLSLPETTLQQAIVNTQVVDGFFVKRVQDVRESAAYLTVMTRYLTKLYQCQTVREVFARQLMQVSGLSGDKAAAILEQYSTPHSLLTAYKKCASEAEKEKLLSSIRYGKLKRNLGPALSRTVYQLYCTQGPLS